MQLLSKIQYYLLPPYLFVPPLLLDSNFLIKIKQESQELKNLFAENSLTFLGKKHLNPNNLLIKCNYII